MLSTQSTNPDLARQDPVRRSRFDIAHALDAFDEFSDPDRPSQRQYADQIGVAHSTFNYWTRKYAPDKADPVHAFFHSAPGEQALRSIVFAALTTFQLEGACGIRLIGTFLLLAGLARWTGFFRRYLTRSLAPTLRSTPGPPRCLPRCRAT